MAIYFTKRQLELIALHICTEMTATEIDIVAEILFTEDSIPKNLFKEKAYKNSRVVQEIESVFDGIQQQQEIAMQRLERNNG